MAGYSVTSCFRRGWSSEGCWSALLKSCSLGVLGTTKTVVTGQTELLEDSSDTIKIIQYDGHLDQGSPNLSGPIDCFFSDVEPESVCRLTKKINRATVFLNHEAHLKHFVKMFGSQLSNHRGYCALEWEVILLFLTLLSSYFFRLKVLYFSLTRELVEEPDVADPCTKRTFTFCHVCVNVWSLNKLLQSVQNEVSSK